MLVTVRIIGYNVSHDSSACLVEDGRIVGALALERVTGIKRGVVPAHSYAAAMSLLTRELLKAAAPRPTDVDHWIATSTESRDQLDEARLLDVLGLFTDPDRRLALPHPGHHLAHASAAFYCSGLEQAAGLVVDAYGSRIGDHRERETAYTFRLSTGPEVVWRTERDSHRIAGSRGSDGLRIPARLSGIGELYRVVTLALGFSEPGSVYDDAGKTMGLAAYGRPLSAEPLFMRIDGGAVQFDGAAQALVDLGFATPAGEGFRLVSRSVGAPLTQLHRDLAAQVQAEFETVCLFLVDDLMRRTSNRELVLSGGCFLNSVLNTRIARECSPERLFVFPAATDDGNAIGAALYAHHALLGGSGPDERAPTPELRHVFLGPDRVPRAPDELLAMLTRWGLVATIHDNAERSAGAAAAAISRGEIIGWFQGRAEFGPRALGNRSILCHPGMVGMKDRLNARVKFRERFRPFAASVLAEHATKWFDLSVEASPFMLFVCPVLPDQRECIPEIVHADGTSRVQTIPADLPGAFRCLVEEFEELTGLPMVLNTSLNTRGRPIVEYPEQAVECLFGTRLDRLFIGPYEIPAPDLTALHPRACAAGEDATSALSDVELLLVAAADGTRSVKEIAESLNLALDQAVDGYLALRRTGQLRWDGVPEVQPPTFPLQQFASAEQA